MPRYARERLDRDIAEAIIGARALRALARTRQTLSNWRDRGVPWDAIGPALVERLSQLSAPHSHDGDHGGADMHVVQAVQGRIFQLARTYGVDSKEFRSVTSLLSVLLPEPAPPRAAAVSAHSVGVLHSDRAARVRQRGTRSGRTTGRK